MVNKVWGASRAGRRPSRTLPRVVPRVEALEARTVPSSTTYTTSADFALGTQLNVNATDTANQLQLNKAATPFPFINVAASDRGTMVRISTDTGVILGEFWTAPQNRPKNPSRTTVDQLGNVWVTNRDEGDGNSGSITKIGLVIGGTRGDKLPDGSFFPNPAGEYLQGPFQYNTCVDKDGDGLIRTSRGLGDIFAWPNTSGVDHDGGVDTAVDEAILLYVRLPGAPGPRHVSVDTANDIWVGGFGGYAPKSFLKLDGDTGAILGSFNAAARFGAGGYGGFIDKNGVLWSSSLSQNGLIRYDTNTDTGAFIGTGGNSYGLGVDTNGYVWNSQWVYNTVVKLAPNGTIVGTFSSGGSGSRGVVVTPVDNNVWIANSNSNTVSRLNNSGTVLKVIGVGSHPTGVAVDAQGKVWVTNYYASTVMRINPAGGMDGLGAVDLTVSLGAGAGPYNYSDMTGIVSIGATSPQGTWTRVQDSGAAGTPWGALTWNTEPAGSVPAGTELKVEARAANTPTGLVSQPWTTAANGVDLPSIIGRYLEVRVTLRPSTGGLTPVLSDITIATEEPSEPPQVVSIDHYAASATEDALTHQRSIIRHIKVTFDKPVTLTDAGAFLLQKTGGPGATGLVALTVDTLGPATSFVLSFSGPFTEYGSLVDGSYQLTLVAAKIQAGGLALDGDGDGTGGDNKVDAFFRFFGDTDGDGDVDNTDSFRMTKVKNTDAAYAIYLAALDFNNTGGFDAADLTQYMKRYGKKKSF